MQQLLIATNNQGKLKEFRDHLREFYLLGLCNFDKEIEEPIENGVSFAENSLIKAKYYAHATSCLTIADDSGLCVNALDGRPGIFSSRYANGDYKQAFQKLNKELEGKEDRSAYFQVVLTLYNPQNDIYKQFNGRCDGKILYQSCGTGGLGYDPLFSPHGLDMSFGECSLEEKNKYDHRKKATDKLVKYLGEIM
ncbi:RdgB/HAM1 family non-canonical purine NTP pyrophosphatase [Patescibacteria group bacterium]|nr:RdgB/HAM1 family non-canonical purine NTP pyrophosphatase [Patescibacteria group bacterium]MBU1246874.1 RdgB/HAM1 family non-canonical purine NTP pyrophosphatase [Patescibacteria group bacterium]MBU1519173.1 RdgB/HAM1 family non-canonical purine NTP pyrophosphatase [Patescibacteria group bacterium]MBU1730416.1 RdgB/HAM1 family non-canonical purine NTP pyrophosphatase [Patescibacteria group bacterium]MBU1956371.1 RdgB/HAM1 family non-canonical purine NTP pyrophosphatase [Patescibacteria group